VAPSPDGVDAPAFARGVRLRREPDGSAVLLVPEGIVRLNAGAAAILELVDGRRSVAEIAAALEGGRYDAAPERIAADVRELIGRLRLRHFLR
jgi:pyrroloquinoline quinone biosynthesis protein D